mmetsp:Transcript_89609/g.145120  ORF Transcript_89609/g.145120 Transcript_89609/m.145120 type:complete len:347 (+) Transcript_89609:109-1149(+)|eukprot:CAMPEP_0179407254 /NCGR_PEP_ID=MMETSP0799-20121207/1385_1 /TAXON_ID=46947 /ORGANISM="Geminigera cryophila, Strain CCMP2564" /LENGTH=346 /DNA_ID=CAMNT_0021178483 /DNA_START=67 /DNA_END=1107 /DNA_ORIENTATION=+
MRTAMLAAMLCILSAMGLDELSASPVGGLGVGVVAARRSKAGMKVVPAAFVPPFAHFHVASRRSVCFSRTLADECCTQPAGTCRREKASVPANQSLRRNWLALRQTVGDEDASGRPNGEVSVPDAMSAGNAAEESTEPFQAVVSIAETHLGRKTLGVDHGRKRTGLCVSIGYAPRPLPLICHDDNSTDVALQVAQVALREGAEQIVVGFPFNSTGGEGEQAVYTRQFVTHLQEACSTCAIYLWDERFSSSVAREKLQQAGYTRMDMKGLVDTVAAIGILSDFFDKNGQGAETIQNRPAGASSPASTPAMLVPVMSYKERLRQMQAAAAEDDQAVAAQGNKKRKKRK